MKLKKTNIYITGNKLATIENVTFGQELTVTKEVTDTEENKAHTWYKITGQTNSTKTSKISFTTDQDNVNISFKIKSSSESGYDYVYLTEIDSANTQYNSNIVNKVSGNGTEKVVDYTVKKAGDHYIYVCYRKDGSGNYYKDCGYVCLLTKIGIQVTEIKSVYVENSKIQQMNVQGKNLFEYELGNTVSWKTMKYNKNTKQFTYDTNDTLYVSYAVSNKYTPAYLSNSPQELGIPMDRNYYYVKFQELNSYQTDYNGNTSYNLTYSLDLTDLVIPKKEKMFITWSDNYVLDYTYLSSIVELYLPLEYVKNKTELKSFLYNKSSLRKTNASDWDVSNITYFGGNRGNNNEYGTFYGCKSLPSLDLSKWNTSKAVNLKGIFENCYSLSSIKFGNNWNTNNVKDTSKMFSYCKSLSSLDTSILNTSNVTDMDNMFNGCSSLASLDLSSFDTANVTDMANMFSGCSSLASLDLSSFDTANVTGMSSMFNGCSSLASLDLSSFDTANVTDMVNMFNGCSSLASLDLSNWNVTKLNNCNSMFNGCKLLETLNLSNWNTGGISNVNSMFANCPRLTSLDLTGINLTGMKQDNYDYPAKDMFKNDDNLTTLIAGHETEENVSILNGLNNSIWLNKCKNLNYESVYALFRGLAQLTTGTRKKIYLPKAMEGKLNTDETLMASRKQWLIQYSDYA